MSTTYFITGTSRGLGFALAREIVENGDIVFATARDPEASHPLLKLHRQHASKCRIHQLDVTDDESVTNVRDAVRGQTIDVLINNAGILRDYFPDLSELSLERMNEVLQTNAIGAVRVTQALEPLLRASKHPRVVNITSGLGSLALVQNDNAYAYRMSKAALNMFTRCLAVNEPGIISVCIDPGSVITDLAGPDAKHTPIESAREILRLISRLEPKDSGKFFKYNGEEMPW